MVLGFGRKRSPPPGPPLGPDGRPIVVRWSVEHLRRLCSENPSFQVMTVDGLQWIDPFTEHLIPAAFDWQEAAIPWMLANKPWQRQDKPLAKGLLYQVRWAHFLHHHLEDQADLRFFLPDGRWLNPLTAEWVSGARGNEQQIPKETRTIMAQALAAAELAGAGSNFKNSYELQRIHSSALNALHQQRRKQESQSMAPHHTGQQQPIVTDQGQPGVRISGRRPAAKVSSDRQRAVSPIPELPHDGVPHHHLRELHGVGYQIGECLGRGGMAAVYKAVQLSLDREVALKVRIPEGDDFNTFVERFLREARMAAKISHPNVITIFDVGRTTSLVYMALEFLGGGDLAQQLQRVGPFSISEALRCLADILRGLGAIHEHGFIHRDIKTANCFIASDGRIAVGDLGIARDIEHERHITNPNAIVGTPAFMSPEQTVPGAQLDGRSDIYAAGVVAFHLMSGQVPFDGEHPMVILRRLISDPTPDLRDRVDGIDPRVAAFILRLMDKDPQQRPGDARLALLECEDLLRQIDR